MNSRCETSERNSSFSVCLFVVSPSRDVNPFRSSFIDYVILYCFIWHVSYLFLCLPKVYFSFLLAEQCISVHILSFIVSWTSFFCSWWAFPINTFFSERSRRVSERRFPYRFGKTLKRLFLHHRWHVEQSTFTEKRAKSIKTWESSVRDQCLIRLLRFIRYAELREDNLRCFQSSLPQRNRETKVIANQNLNLASE